MTQQFCCSLFLWVILSKSPSYAGFHPCRLQKQGMATACCELAYEGLGGVARNNRKQEKWQVEELPLTSLKMNMSPGPFQKRT